MTEEANNDNAAKASKPLAPEPPVSDEDRGVLAMRVEIHINERGDVATGVGVGNVMAHAYFFKRYPLAAAMLTGLMRGPQEPYPPTAGLPTAQEPGEPPAAPDG